MPASYGRTEFFDRHPRLPIVVLLLLPFVLHLPLWLTGRTVDPMWFVSGITQQSSALPGSTFIDPNVGFTSEALGHLAAWDWLHGIVPWWNPYTGVGMPLAGEMQPEAFFLPFSLLLIFRDGILWQMLCMQIIAGLSTYALLRELGLSRLAALMAGVVYSVNCTIAWVPGPAAVYCSLPFLPLTLWGIELSRQPRRAAAGSLAVGAAIAWSILAGFPEPAYISGLLAMAWGAYRLVGERSRWAMLRRCVGGFMLGLLVAAPLLLSFIDYVQQSDSFSIHKSGETSLPWFAFSSFLMPYVFGPLMSTYGSKPLGAMWGSTGGYCGVLVVLFAIVGATGAARQRGLKLLLAAWVALSLAKTFGVQPIQGLMNHIPLLRQAGFYRYAQPSWVLALIILAAFGLDEFSDECGDAFTHGSNPGKPPRRWPFLSVLAITGVGLALAWPTRAVWSRPSAPIPKLFILAFVSLAWVLVTLALAAFAWVRLQSEKRRLALAGLLAFDAIVVFMVPNLSSVRGYRVDATAIRFLRDHQGLSRNYTLGPLQPNYGAYYRVASIDHNVLPVPRTWARYVDAHLLPGLIHEQQGVTFWPGVSGEQAGQRALDRNFSSYQDQGVRYIITDRGVAPAPETYIPGRETPQPPVPGLGESILFRLSFTGQLLRWSHAIVNRQDPSSLKRWLAANVLRYGHALDLREQALEAGNNAREGVDTLTLLPGKSAQLSLSLPASELPITTVGVLTGLHNEGVDGALSVQLCAGTVCASGERNLAGIGDAEFVRIPLERPLTVQSAMPLRLSVMHEGGMRPVSLALVGPDRSSSRLGLPGGVHVDRVPQIALQFGDPLPGTHLVYRDTLLDIWELPNPAPYYEVVRGGPCTLTGMERERLAVDCASPAVLKRRELYMPGWSVRVKSGSGGKTVPVDEAGLFQLATLPKGHSEATYRFVPPHMGFAWAASAIGIGGLLWNLFQLLRNSTFRTPA